MKKGTYTGAAALMIAALWTGASTAQLHNETLPTSGFAASGRKPALDAEPKIHPDLIKHIDHVERSVYKIGETVFAAVGWSRINTIMIEADDGVIIVDPGPSPRSARAARFELKKHTDKPIQAIVYTHADPDHWGGSKAYLTTSDTSETDIDIYAHQSMIEALVKKGSLLGPIRSMRDAYGSGLTLPGKDLEGITSGVGRADVREPGTLSAPTKIIEGAAKVDIAGVTIRFLPVEIGGSTQLVLYLPESRILLAGMLLQGPALSANQTLRGSRMSDPMAWLKTIDELRRLEAEQLVPSHGRPVFGKKAVEEHLRLARDAVQYLHDQTIRLMNKGMTRDELARVVKLPPYLRDYEPYLRGYYGTVPDAVRQIYTYYMGWFTGDPTELNRLKASDSARRLVELMGGWRQVLDQARQALASGEYQWAAELATYVIRTRPTDKRAKRVKAAALRALGFASKNITHRNWYLTAAQELSGTINPVGALRQAQAPVLSPGVIALWPACSLVESLSTRLRADVTEEIHMTVGFVFTDLDQSCALEIRRSIAQFHAVTPADADFTVTITREVLFGLLQGQLSVSDGLATGQLAVSEGSDTLRDFLELFDAQVSEIHISNR